MIKCLYINKGKRKLLRLNHILSYLNVLLNTNSFVQRAKFRAFLKLVC